MSELEAAIDVVQLQKMTRTVARFRAVKTAVLKRLARFGEITPQVLNDPEGEVGYTLRFFPDTVARGQRIVAALHERKIQASMRGEEGWPLTGTAIRTCTPLSAQCDFKRGDCPVADDLFEPRDQRFLEPVVHARRLPNAGRPHQ